MHESEAFSPVEIHHFYRLYGADFYWKSHRWQTQFRPYANRISRSFRTALGLQSKVYLITKDFFAKNGCFQ